MFEWLFKDKSGNVQDVLELIAVNMAKIQLAALAQEKAAGMIAKAISKSEIVLSEGEKRRKDSEYYRLNIRPNDNETGTDFWYQVARNLVSTGDQVVVRLGSGKYYRASSYTTDNYVLYQKTYRDITLTDGKDEVTLTYGVPADDVLHFRYSTDKIRLFTSNVLNLFNDSINAMNQMTTVANTPIFKYVSQGRGPVAVDKTTGQKLTINEVLDRYKQMIESKEISIFWKQDDIDLEYLDIKASVTASDIKSMADTINAECAAAYDIPVEVFNGTITEKSDATNEFITYAVSPVAEVINDTLNAKLVGESDYVKGERAFVWLAHYKHIDVIDAASNLDKLRSIGFTLDEIFEMVGYPALGTEFSTTRALTKNYAAEGEEEGAMPTGGAEDPAEEQTRNSNPKAKHKERRKERYGK